MTTIVPGSTVWVRGTYRARIVGGHLVDVCKDQFSDYLHEVKVADMIADIDKPGRDTGLLWADAWDAMVKAVESCDWQHGPSGESPVDIIRRHDPRMDG